MQAYINLPTGRCLAPFMMEHQRCAHGASRLLMLPAWPPAAARVEHSSAICSASYGAAPCRLLRHTWAFWVAVGVCIPATKLSSGFLLQFELNCCWGTIHWICINVNDSLDTEIVVSPFLTFYCCIMQKVKFNYHNNLLGLEVHDPSWRQKCSHL